LEAKRKLAEEIGQLPLSRYINMLIPSDAPGESRKSEQEQTPADLEDSTRVKKRRDDHVFGEDSEDELLGKKDSIETSKTHSNAICGGEEDVEKSRIIKTTTQMKILNSWPSALNHVVASYLVHYGYGQTASVFTKEANVQVKEKAESMKQRMLISDAILIGDMDKVFDLLDSFFPAVLPRYPALHFRLKLQKFIEMVAAGSANTESGSLSSVFEYGRELKLACDTKFNNEKNTSLLEEAFSLLADKDPYEGPAARLLSLQYKEVLADDTCCCILESQNLPARPALESIVRQLKICLDQMRANKVPSGSLFVLSDFI
jgi:hypothetical protein